MFIKLFIDTCIQEGKTFCCESCLVWKMVNVLRATPEQVLAYMHAHTDWYALIK